MTWKRSDINFPHNFPRNAECRVRRVAVLLSPVVAVLVVASASGQVPAWRVTVKPVTAIGALGGAEAAELSGVTSALRLPDGRVVVANSSPLEVRVYDATGKFVLRLGRKGQGPGEYRGRITVHQAPGDSVQVFDDALQRWTVFTVAGTLGRTWTSTPEDQRRWAPIAENRTLIHPMPGGTNSCMRSVLRAVPEPRDSAYLEVMPDGTDRFWLRPEGTEVWRVLALDGRLLGTVRLPARFEMFHIGSGFVTGKIRLSDDVEQVVVFGVTMPPHDTKQPLCASQMASFPRDTSRLRRNLQVDLLNLETASQAVLSDYGHYPSFDTIRSLGVFRNSTGVTMSTRTLGGTGLDVVDRMKELPGFCRLLIGDTAPAWLYRFPWCDKGSSQ